MSSDRIEGSIKNGFGRVQDGLGGLTGDSGLQAKGKLNEAAGFVQDVFGQAKDHVSDILDTARDRSSDGAERVQKGVRSALDRTPIDYADIEKVVVENPLAALGVAAIAGIVVGLLLRRPSR
jgi:uncharacterized protein YjbJ (UPF0337 family)